MFKKNRLTDFEKLLFAEKYIEELKKQNKSLIEKNKKLNGIIHSNKDKHTIQALRGQVSKMQKQSNEMHEELSRYRKQNSNKIYENLKNK